MAAWCFPFGAAPVIFSRAMAKSVTKHVDQETGDKYLAPFNYRDVDALPQMLVDAGFRDVDVKPLLVDRTMSEIAQNISKEILGHPSGPRFCRRVRTSLKPYPVKSLLPVLTTGRAMI